MNFCDSNNPIWYCEEFECNTNFDKETKKDANMSESENNKILSNSSKESTDKNKGLCINCENREICKLHIPESGVWHCEEYE